MSLPKFLTARELKSRLQYDPTTGVFTWLYTNNPRVEAGSVAGCIDGKGYRKIMVNKKLYSAARLAFLYMKGEFPSSYMDHINGDRSDDRWRNLREVSPTDNAKNKARQRNNTSGVVGVSFHNKSNKWRVQVVIDRKNKHIGCFEHIADAIEASKLAHGINNYHRNHGRT